MFEIVQSRIVLLILATVCWCSQAICAGGGWGVLSAQDTADINALLPNLAVAGQGLWGAIRSNPPAMNPRETPQRHYNKKHGPRGIHTKTLPFFDGAPVAAVGGASPATAEEVVMANFIATLIPPPPAPGAPPVPPPPPVVVPPTALVRTKRGGAREIRIPVGNGLLGWSFQECLVR